MHRMKRIVSLVILAAMAISAMLGLVSCGGTGLEYDYSKKNMAKFISIDRADYYGVKVTVPLADKVSDEEVQKFIDDLLLQNATQTPYTDGAIRDKDTVAIWYRGQVEIDGKWVDFVGGSNLHGTAQSLTIGSGQFIPGFEDALIGKNIEDAKLSLFVDRNKVVGEKGEPIVYVSYNYKYKDADGKDRSGSYRDRIDLHTDDEGNFTVPGRYDGTTLREDILGKSIGTVLDGPYTASFDITGDLKPESVTITNVKITHIVESETTFGENGYFEISFPEEYPSNEDLAGKKTRWYVSAVSATRPVLPEITDTFITGTLKITYEELLPFINELKLPTDTEDEKKAAMVEVFDDFIRDYLEADLDSAVYNAALTELLEHMIAKVNVKKYPKNLVEDTEADLWEQFTAQYQSYMSSSSSSGAYYASVNEYIVALYGKEYFPNGVSDINAGVRRITEETIKQRMLIYYIADAEGLNFSRKEKKQAYADRVNLLLEYYNSYYGTTGTANAFTEKDLEDAGYTKEKILDELLTQKVYDFLYNGLKESGSITYEPAED